MASGTLEAMHETRAVARALDRWRAAALQGEPAPAAISVEVVDPVRTDAAAVDLIARAWLMEAGMPTVSVRVVTRAIRCLACGAASAPGPGDPECPACGSLFRPSDGPAVAVTDAA
jgi:hypothetical protein